MYRSPTYCGTGHQDPPEIRSTSAGQHVAAEGRNAGNHVLERLPDSLWRRWAQNGTKKGHGMDMLVAISTLDLVIQWAKLCSSLRRILLSMLPMVMTTMVTFRSNEADVTQRK